MVEFVSLAVTGMKCGGCESNVTTKLLSLTGVKSVSASSKEKSVKVEFDPDQIDISRISQAIKEVGYTVEEDN